MLILFKYMTGPREVNYSSILELNLINPKKLLGLLITWKLTVWYISGDFAFVQNIYLKFARQSVQFQDTSLLAKREKT